METSLNMSKSIIAVVGGKGEGKTGGEKYDARLLQAAEKLGIEVCYITWSDFKLDAYMTGRFVWRLRYVCRSLWLSFVVWRSSGVVFVDGWMAPYLIPWALFTKRSVLLMVHHLLWPLEKRGVSRVWVKCGEKLLIHKSKRILTVSQSSCRQIQALQKELKDIDCIPPGFERKKKLDSVREEARKEIVLLFVGYVTRVKGVLDLVKAVSLLSQKTAWKLNIVGSSSSEPETLNELKRIISDMGLEGKVQLHGRVEKDRLQGLYQSADIFILPSYWEGYGIVFIEAMSMGLPIISTTAGAIPEVVTHHKTGLLVEAGDIQGLSKSIERLINSSEMRESMGQAGKNIAKRVADWQITELSFRDWWQARLNML